LLSSLIRLKHLGISLVVLPHYDDTEVLYTENIVIVC